MSLENFRTRTVALFILVLFSVVFTTVYKVEHRFYSKRRKHVNTIFKFLRNFSLETRTGCECFSCLAAEECSSIVAVTAFTSTLESANLRLAGSRGGDRLRPRGADPES